MLASPQNVGQKIRPMRIAIVEDNATARANLRSHLMGIDNFEVASYSNGNELRNGLRLNNFDLVLMDFHLGQSKNGVEWINSLTEQELFKSSMGLVFITSDGMPQTIGQILDLHPDFILIKPYSIKGLSKNLSHFLKLRKEILPVLLLMNDNKNDRALTLVTEKLTKNANKRFTNDLLKLKGRLLLAEKQYSDAISLYSGVLEKSSNVLWAHWGLIKSEFFTGKWQQCQGILNHLVSESLMKDKAFEWLASVSVGKEDYKEAEILLDNIKDSELTIQATRLKVLALNMQDKHEQAQILLEKKIQSNLSVKDRVNEYSLELARFHIQMAESLASEYKLSDKHSTKTETLANLATARKLIGKASRTTNDRHVDLQKDYMLALAFIIEEDKDRALQILEKNGSINLSQHAKASTMIDAVKVYFGVGQTDKANEILLECDEYLLKNDNHIEHLVCNDLINEIEESQHLQKDRALQSNDKGNAFYLSKEYPKALNCFFKAYKMFPGIPAFSLNLLQCMADLAQFEYQDVHAQDVFKELKSITLSQKNQVRLGHIKLKFGF